MTGSQRLAELGFRRDGDVWRATNCEVTLDLILDRLKIEVRLPNGNVIGCFGRRKLAFTEVTNR
jgi:hypothetical protein